MQKKPNSVRRLALISSVAALLATSAGAVTSVEAGGPRREFVELKFAPLDRGAEVWKRSPGPVGASDIRAGSPRGDALAANLQLFP